MPNLFGDNNNSQGHSTTQGLFGPPQSTGGLFDQSQPSQSGHFGSSQPPQGSLFGGQPRLGGLFGGLGGQTSQPSLFGGSQPSGGGHFDGPQPAPSLSGQPAQSSDTQGRLPPSAPHVDLHCPHVATIGLLRQQLEEARRKLEDEIQRSAFLEQRLGLDRVQFSGLDGMAYDKV